MTTPITSEQFEGPRPDRLWSLWEIMEPFDASLFLRLMELVGIARTQSIWEKSFPPHTYAYDESSRAALGRLLGEYEKSCITMELTASLASVRKLQAEIVKCGLLHSDLIPLEIELGGRLYDEMVGRSFWSLTFKESERYNNPRKSWETIIERFPSGVGDIDEAQKCFALSRYAASVFHSLQVVELGIIALGQVIRVTDPHPGWAATDNALQNILKKKYSELNQFERQHWAFFEQIHATIEGLKNAWRNKVSHAHGKLTLMTADFSPDVAEDILHATRAFMRRLATDGPRVSQEPPS